MPEPLPWPRTVDGRCFLELRIDGLQAGEQADCIERNAAPDVHNDYRDHCQIRIAQPVDAPMDEPEAIERPVDHAEGRIEHPFPGEGREHGRNNEWQEHERPRNRFAFEMPVEQKRKPQAECELEHGRDTRVPTKWPGTPTFALVTASSTPSMNG